jgi:outer membrane protein
MMIIRLSFLLLVAFLAIAAGRAGAEEGNGRDSAAIAVVDIQAVMQSAAAAREAHAQYEVLAAADEARVAEDMAAVTAGYESLLAERDALSAEEYQDRLIDLRAQAEAAQRRALERRDALDRALRDALEEISSAVEWIANEFIRESGLSAIQPRSAFIGTPALPDVTDDVLRRLDEILPSVRVNRPEA